MGCVIKNEDSSSFDNYATPSGRGYAVWDVGNMAPHHTCNATSLIGKIGVDGKPFLIDERAYINQTGRLYLRVNVSPLYDNYGAFVAVIDNRVGRICEDGIRVHSDSSNVDSGNNSEIMDNELINNQQEAGFELYPNPASEDGKF